MSTVKKKFLETLDRPAFEVRIAECGTRNREQTAALLARIETLERRLDEIMANSSSFKMRLRAGKCPPATIVEIVSQITGVTVARMASGRRRRDNKTTWARQLCFWFFIHRLGMTYAQAAGVFGQTHGVAIHGLRIVANLCDAYEDHAKQREEARSEIEKVLTS